VSRNPSKPDPEQYLTENGWTLRQGAKPTIVVTEHPRHGRRIYAGSPKEIVRHLARNEKGTKKMAAARFILNDPDAQTRAIQAADVVPPAGKPAISNSPDRSGRSMKAGQPKQAKSKGDASSPVLS
jgi:hypothetical protein